VVGAEPAVWKTFATLFFFLLKTGFFIVVFMLVRWTVPRFRYDQVMDLGWKLMLPTALAVVTVTAGTILILDEMGVAFGFGYGAVLTVVNGIMLALFLLIVDRGRIMTGGHSVEEKRAHGRAVARFHKEEFEVGGVG
jgi:NADH-quinone oxidoreductase subunit H